MPRESRLLILKGGAVTHAIQWLACQCEAHITHAIILNKGRLEHNSIERGVEKGSGGNSTIRGRKRSVFNQTNIGTVSRPTLGRLQSTYGPFGVLRS